MKSEASRMYKWAVNGFLAGTLAVSYFSTRTVFSDPCRSDRLFCDQIGDYLTVSGNGDFNAGNTCNAIPNSDLAACYPIFNGLTLATPIQSGTIYFQLDNQNVHLPIGPNNTQVTMSEKNLIKVLNKGNKLDSQALYYGSILMLACGAITSLLGLYLNNTRNFFGGGGGGDKPINPIGDLPQPDKSPKDNGPSKPPKDDDVQLTNDEIRRSSVFFREKERTK